MLNSSVLCNDGEVEVGWVGGGSTFILPTESTAWQLLGLGRTTALFRLYSHSVQSGDEAGLFPQQINYNTTFQKL